MQQATVPAILNMSVMGSSGSGSVSVSGSKTLCFVDTDTDPDPDADGYISILRIAATVHRRHARMRERDESAFVPAPSLLRRGGFSLIEILVAVTLLLLITVMISMVFQQAGGAWASGTSRVRSESAIRAALGSVERDLLNAVDPRDYPGAPLGPSSANTISFVALQHRYDHRVPPNSGRHPAVITYVFGAGILSRWETPMNPDGSWGTATESIINSGLPLTAESGITFTTVPRPSDPDGLPLRVDIRAEAPALINVFTISGRSSGKNRVFELDAERSDDIRVGGRL